MDKITVPYRIESKVATFEGDWTAEQIDAGEAGEPKEVVVASDWYEPSPDGPVKITDQARINELERGLVP